MFWITFSIKFNRICITFARFLLFFLFREMHQKTSQKILINFCISLLFLLVIFTAGIQQTNEEIACKIVASLIELFLLSTFSWMGIMAVGFYKKIVKATQNLGESKTFFQICFVAGWGEWKSFYSVTHKIKKIKKLESEVIIYEPAKSRVPHASMCHVLTMTRVLNQDVKLTLTASRKI